MDAKESSRKFYGSVTQDFSLRKISFKHCYADVKSAATEIKYLTSPWLSPIGR